MKSCKARLFPTLHTPCLKAQALLVPLFQTLDRSFLPESKPSLVPWSHNTSLAGPPSKDQTRIYLQTLISVNSFLLGAHFDFSCHLTRLLTVTETHWTGGPFFWQILATPTPSADCLLWSHFACWSGVRTRSEGKKNTGLYIKYFPMLPASSSSLALSAPSVTASWCSLEPHNPGKVPDCLNLSHSLREKERWF